VEENKMKYIAIALILSLFVAGCGTGFVVAPLDEVTPQDKECIKERIKVQGQLDNLGIEFQSLQNDYTRLQTEHNILKNTKPNCPECKTCQECQVCIECVNETIYINETIVINETVYVINNTALEECQLELNRTLSINVLENCSNQNGTEI
jgi:hypothetical protein